MSKASFNEDQSGGFEALRWAGPRPLGVEDTLVGRQKELDDLITACRNHETIVITASSGIGKTSFVKAGLVPKLLAMHTTVPEIRAWPDATSKIDLTEPGAAHKLYKVIAGLDPDDPRPARVALDELIGEDGSAVVIIDQFEELLRYQRGVAEELLKLAGHTAHDTGIPHVVIARSEYRVQLRPFEVRGAVWALNLQELKSNEVLRAIIETGLVRTSADGATNEKMVAIDDAAAEALARWWHQARDSVTQLKARQIGAEGLADVGLLHFQALLWSFKSWVAGPDRPRGNHITLKLVEEFAAVRASSAGKRYDIETAGAWLIENVLVDYVSQQANRLAEPLTLRLGETQQRDDRELRWRNGPRLMLARIAPAMTAAGFKQPQSLYSLLPYALSDELTQRRARELETTLQQGDLDRAAAIEKFGRGVSPAGTAFGWSTQEVVDEMIDSLHAALQAMSSTDVNILREFDRPGQPIYELVHDGMGSALNTWAQGFLSRPLSTVAVIAAQPGRVMMQDITAAMFQETQPLELWGAVQDDGKRVTITGLRWPASLVDGATISDINFDRCDFLGASFEGCTLRNVTFNNCALVSTVMINCALENVEFRARSRARWGPMLGGHDGVNLLTVKNPKSGINVRFVELPNTTGIVLEELDGGSIDFFECVIRHLITNADSETTLEFERCRVNLFSLNHAIKVHKDEGTTLSGMFWG